MNVPIKAFVSYEHSPANGLDGFISISYSKYNHDTNFLAQLNMLETEFRIKNYQFYFESVDTSDINALYKGELILSEEPLEETTRNMHLAGTVNIDK